MVIIVLIYDQKWTARAVTLIVTDYTRSLRRGTIFGVIGTYMSWL